MIKHKRKAVEISPVVKAIGDYYDRVAITFLVPKAHAKAITEAASYSGNLLCEQVIVTDHLILAKPRLAVVEKTILKTTSNPR